MRIEIILEDPTKCTGCPMLVYVKYPNRTKPNPACQIGFTGEQGTGYDNGNKYVLRPKQCIERHGK
ncbi:hypothetical protein KAR91_15235 [Candidatus Pacearchaeota archaeon]|nr:hypothetical protein [Candidatus Pacearchaeota archaeon]